MIQIATARDIPGLIKIWESCFTTDANYIDNFFKNSFPHSHTFIIKTNDIVISSVSILPSHTKIQYNGSFRRVVGGYLYAVGTLPEFRNKGFSKLLTSFAVNYCKEKGYSFIAVYPAEANLYSLYIKQGFIKELYCNFTKINIKTEPKSITDKTCLEIKSKEDLFILLEKTFKTNTLLFDMSLTDFILKDISNKKGVLYKTISDDLILIDSPLDSKKELTIVGSLQLNEFLTICEKASFFENAGTVNYMFPAIDSATYNELEGNELRTTRFRRGLMLLLDLKYEESFNNLFLLYPIE